jgi:hypothetical protein
LFPGINGLRANSQVKDHTSSSGLGCRVALLEKKDGSGSAATSKRFLVSVVTGMSFAVPVEAIWKRLMFYEQIEKRPPWLLRLLLPIPIRTDGHVTEAGDEIKCCYHNGYLLKRVTQIVRGQFYAFDVIEQRLALPRAIRLSQGSYTLRELPNGGTEVSLETRYLSGNRPRWLCHRIEAAVCHLFHSHILNAIGQRPFVVLNMR